MAVQPIAGMMDGRDTVSAESQRTNTRALVVGLALLGLIVFGLVAAFVIGHRSRPPVGLDNSSAVAGQTQPSTTQVQPSDSVIVRTESDISRLRTPLEQEVVRSYFRYWAVYGSAMETRNTAVLGEVAAAGRLQEAIDEVGDLVAEGIAAKIQVAHTITILSVTENDATVRDDYLNSSYVIDPVTRLPVGEAGASERFVNTYFMRRVNGVWKVVGGQRGGG